MAVGPRPAREGRARARKARCDLAIVDYGIGNLGSVTKALPPRWARPPILSGDLAELRRADVARPARRRRLRRHDGRRSKAAGSCPCCGRRWTRGAPLLGICIGMQLLFEESEEHGRHRGLGLLPGRVRRLEGDLPVPAHGLEPAPSHAAASAAGRRGGRRARLLRPFLLLRRAGGGRARRRRTTARDFPAIVGRGNVLGVQFHPEKSQAVGLRLMANFVRTFASAPGGGAGGPRDRRCPPSTSAAARSCASSRASSRTRRSTAATRRAVARKLGGGGGAAAARRGPRRRRRRQAPVRRHRGRDRRREDPGRGGRRPARARDRHALSRSRRRPRRSSAPRPSPIPAWCRRRCGSWPESVAVALDARNGKVAVAGWKEITRVDAVELAAQVKGWGVSPHPVHRRDARRHPGGPEPRRHRDDGARGGGLPITRRGRHLDPGRPRARGRRSSRSAWTRSSWARPSTRSDSRWPRPTRPWPRRRPEAMTLAKRLVPCLDVDRGRVVKGVKFVSLRDAGDPVECAARYDAEGADELVFLDITASSDARPIVLDMVRRVADTVFLPFTVGRRRALGRGRGRAPARGRGQGRRSTRPPSTTRRSSSGSRRRFGSQAVVLAIDARASRRRRRGAEWEVFVRGGRTPTGRDAVAWAREGAERGAGEILLTSMDRDGTKDGFDVALNRAVSEAVTRARHRVRGLRLGRAHGRGADARARRARPWPRRSSTSARSASPTPRRELRAAGVEVRRMSVTDPRGRAVRRERARPRRGAGPRERRRAHGGLRQRGGAGPHRARPASRTSGAAAAARSGRRARPRATCCTCVEMRARLRPRHPAARRRSRGAEPATRATRTCFGDDSPTAAGIAGGARRA